MKTKSLSKPMNKFLPLLITVLFALLLSACSSTQNADSDAQAADISTPVISNNGVTVEGRLNPIDSAQAHVNAAQKALDAMVLSAPFDGVVTSIDATIGQVVSAKEPILHLADFSSWVGETVDLDEIKAVKIDSGKPVTLTVDAFPGLELHGTVEWISLDYTEKSGDILYSARIRLDDSDPRLRWG
ncbi:MAG: HlyD family efflux transporter periplasmic adaptor subunit, partial [Veillonellales bacterium]